MRQNKTTKLVINALLLGIGLMLHQITPALGLPMQPDFAIAMLFIVMIMNNNDYKTSMSSALVIGIFTAMTTKFPGGQVPNVIDKVVTANCMYVVIMVISKMQKNKDIMRGINIISIAIIMALGTLISGTVFLGSAYLLVGLPAGFGILFATVVLPSCAINSVVGAGLFKIIETSLKRTQRA